MHAIKVLSAGGYTSIQDMGRFGYQHMGIPVSGALDNFAFSIANLLVGNHENTAALEITIVGPSLEIRKEMNIALAGAEMGILVNGRPVDEWCSIHVKPGDIVDIGQVKAGCRAYLAVSGGFEVPKIMGSYSTYAGAGIGGFKGRQLKKDDELNTFEVPCKENKVRMPEKLIPQYPEDIVVRAIPGPQDDFFDMGIKTIFQHEYMVTAKADRMGYRLNGKTIPIKNGMPKSIISEPSVPGSIQIPPDEQPIILLLEQTVGGYAKIATIISTDISIVAQATPGDSIQFEQIDINTAHNLVAENKKKMESIKDILTPLREC